MRLAKKYSVPRELALLYEFLNSVDLRTYVDRGEQHVPSDELKTRAEMEAWMRERGLIKKTEAIAPADHRRALELRSALRSFLECPRDSGESARACAEGLNRMSECYPLVVRIGDGGIPGLKPRDAAAGLALVLAEFYTLAASGRLNRLKMCSSDECHWIFFDRSKPVNRRWCSSLTCGNRQKTRNYRERQKANFG